MTKIEVDPLQDLEGLIDEIQKETESERGKVIISGAFLDAQLRNLISKFLVDDSKIVDDLLGSEKNMDRPLSSFSSRIKAAYCLGLISKSMYDDLNKIKRIRNRFAHKMHGYNFDDPEIVRWCKSLKISNMIINVSSHIPNTHGFRFLLSVILLVNLLTMKTLEVEKIRRSVPNDQLIGKVYKEINKRNNES